MRFGSVCSGIEAASVAWHGLGWEPAWLAEVDVAAANVLSHRLGATAPRFPLPKTERVIAKMRWGDRVTNWGDMTKLPDLVRSGEAEAPDVFCGGTPCQAFSVAGRREGLNDDRGNLTLTFVEIANEIDLKRAENGDEPCIIFWENVPGVLSDKTNAFGCLLAGLAGEDVPLEPSGKRWSDAGCVIGPQRTVAWRSLDAQYFGLAQRRERVFVVASAREGFDPVEILLEFDGVRRDSAPSREAWEETAGTLDASSTGGGFPGSDGACSGHVVPAIKGADGGLQRNGGRDTERGSGRSGRAVGLTTEQTPKFSEDVALTLTKQSPSGGGQPQAVVYPQWWDGSSVSQTLDAVLHKGQTMPEKNRFPAVLQPIPFDTTQILNTANNGKGCSEDGTGRGVPTVAFMTRGSNVDVGSISGTIGCNCDRASGSAPMVLREMAVRRLMPVEAERLQGFFDWWTAAPTTPVSKANQAKAREAMEAGDPSFCEIDGVIFNVAADGPRYKQLGNSWAVPVVTWIGARIDRHVRALDSRTVSATLDAATVAWIIAA